MAGINLLNQLKNKRSGAGDSSPAASPTPSAPRFDFSASREDSVLALKFIAMAAIFYAAYFFGTQYIDQENGRVQVQIDSVQAQIAKENIKKNQLKGVGEEMKGYQARVQELENKIKAVSTKDINRNYLVRALEYVATEMPREMWFNEITTVHDDATSASQMSFTGYALSAQAVSEFIQKLELSVYFPTTSLERMELVNDAPANTPGVVKIPPSSRRFQIVAKMGE